MYQANGWKEDTPATWCTRIWKEARQRLEGSNQLINRADQDVSIVTNMVILQLCIIEKRRSASSQG